MKSPETKNVYKITQYLCTDYENNRFQMSMATHQVQFASFQ